MILVIYNTFSYFADKTMACIFTGIACCYFSLSGKSLMAGPIKDVFSSQRSFLRNFSLYSFCAIQQVVFLFRLMFIILVPKYSRSLLGIVTLLTCFLIRLYYSAPFYVISLLLAGLNLIPAYARYKKGFLMQAYMSEQNDDDSDEKSNNKKDTTKDTTMPTKTKK
jgi:hypothetical protein